MQLMNFVPNGRTCVIKISTAMTVFAADIDFIMTAALAHSADAELAIIPREVNPNTTNATWATKFGFTARVVCCEFGVLTRSLRFLNV